MEQEVPDEVQAAMALKLVDDVRAMIRKEIKLALEDYSFMGQLGGFQLGEAIVRSGVLSSTAFRDAVKTIITQQMQKY